MPCFNSGRFVISDQMCRVNRHNHQSAKHPVHWIWSDKILSYHGVYISSYKWDTYSASNVFTSDGLTALYMLAWLWPLSPTLLALSSSCVNNASLESSVLIATSRFARIFSNTRLRRPQPWDAALNRQTEQFSHIMQHCCSLLASTQNSLVYHSLSHSLHRQNSSVYHIAGVDKTSIIDTQMRLNIMQLKPCLGAFYAIQPWNGSDLF